MFPTDSNLETKFTFEAEGQPIPEDPPFHILLLGDWSGRENSPVSLLIRPHPIVVDRDNFDKVLEKLNVSAELDLERNGKNLLNLRFKSLDDFHPDRIFQRVPLFSELREVRQGLLNPDSFEKAAREVRSWFDTSEGQTEPDPDEPPVVQSDVSQPDAGGLLDQILSQSGGEKTSAQPAQITHSRDLSRFIGKIVKDHVIQTDESEQARLLELVDQATSELMRNILHHPRFQALEAAWRGLHLLVRQIETDIDLKLHLLDISQDELAGNLKSASNLADTDLYKWLIRETIETPGGEPFAVVCGNYTFGANVDDIATLIRLAQLGSYANAPFLSYILPEMFGISSLADHPNQSDWKISDDSNARKLWLTLRSLPEAEYIGLAIPRFLSRLPYGESTDPTETFSFEEFTPDSKHEDYLWANPAFACTLLLAKSYRQNGWEMGSNLFQDLSSLPTHFFEEDGEARTKPCAEIVMTETTCQTLLDEGLMPLISYRNSDRVVLGRFQSVATPNKALKGGWN